MSPSEALRAAIALAAIGIAGCGTPPPGDVDREQLAVDLKACIRNEPACVITGPFAGPAELLVPEEKSAIYIAEGTTVSLPLLRPDATSKLAYLVLGSVTPPHAKKEDNDAGTPHLLSVGVTGFPTSTFRTNEGWARIELTMPNTTPPPDARVELTAVRGPMQLMWVVGRWND